MLIALVFLAVLNLIASVLTLFVAVRVLSRMHGPVQHTVTVGNVAADFARPVASFQAKQQAADL